MEYKNKKERTFDQLIKDVQNSEVMDEKTKDLITMCLAKDSNLKLSHIAKNTFFKEDIGVSFWDKIPKASEGVES